MLTRHLNIYMIAERSSWKLQAHRSHRSTKDLAPERAHTSVMKIMESASVAIHVLPIKGTAQVKFKVVVGTEPTLSMTMLVANGNK